MKRRNYFKEKVYQTVIPRNIRLTESPSFGKPIALYDKESLGAQKYEELCKEILGCLLIQVQSKEKHNGKKSFRKRDQCFNS